MFFATIERQALRRGDFASIQELIAAIAPVLRWLESTPPALSLTKDADQIRTTLTPQPTASTTARGAH